jgi:glycosyltransferase involved in cell wall biosynthesis
LEALGTVTRGQDGEVGADGLAPAMAVSLAQHGTSEGGSEATARREGSPKVSIGLVVYNGDRFLPAALDSLLAQTFTDFELILSDNASTDRTPAICEEAAERDERVRYVRQPRNIGPGANFLFVLGQARGEYFMWAAHDDVREPDFIESLVRELDRHPRAILASSHFDNIDSEGRLLRHFDRDWGAVFTGRKSAQFGRLISMDEVRSQKANHIYGLIRRDVLCAAAAEVARVDTFSGNDNCTLLELLGRGDFVIVPKVLFHYRVPQPPPGRKEAELSARPGGSLRYLWARVRGAVPEHRGNLIAYLRSSSEYFSGIRTVVSRQRSFTVRERLGLYMLAVLRQLWRPLDAVGEALKREL